MIFDFFKQSRMYFLIVTILGLLFFVISMFFSDYVILMDEWAIYVVSEYLVSDTLTIVMKIVTNLGGVLAFASFLFVLFLVISNRKVGFLMSINLFIAYMFSVLFKNVFRRERPLEMLVDKPFDFSFPSGHTICSIVFYGFLIYVVSKLVKNVNIRRLINFFLVIIIVLVPFSRVYLGVHFLTDVLAGVILGIVCLLSFINYVKIKKLL